MQGDILLTVLPFFLTVKTTVPKSSAISTFLVDFFGLFVLYGFSGSISDSRGAGSAYNALSLWLSLVSPLVAKFFGFDPGAAGLPCTSPSASAFSLGRSLSVREGYIHWLVPTGATRRVTWSVAVTRRRHTAGASVPAV